MSPGAPDFELVAASRFGGAHDLLLVIECLAVGLLSSGFLRIRLFTKWFLVIQVRIQSIRP